MKKRKIKFEKNKSGVTIWIDGKWVLDASCFKDDSIITIDNARMKMTRRGKLIDFKLKKDK